jgi:hypothetical protein
MATCIICQRATKTEIQIDDMTDFGYCKKHEFHVHVYVTKLISKIDAAEWLETQRKNESKSKGNPGAAKTKRR